MRNFGQVNGEPLMIAEQNVPCVEDVTSWTKANGSTTTNYIGYVNIRCGM